MAFAGLEPQRALRNMGVIVERNVKLIVETVFFVHRDRSDKFKALVPANVLPDNVQTAGSSAAANVKEANEKSAAKKHADEKIAEDFLNLVTPNSVTPLDHECFTGKSEFGNARYIIALKDGELDFVLKNGYYRIFVQRKKSTLLYSRDHIYDLSAALYNEPENLGKSVKNVLLFAKK